MLIFFFFVENFCLLIVIQISEDELSAEMLKDLLQH